MIEHDLTDLHRFMAFDSWYCRHRMTLIFTFRYSNHRVVLHFFIVWRYAVFLTFKISPLGLDPRRPRPREIPNGRMPWFPFWSLDWIGPESEPCSARKKGAKREKHCNAMHGICVLKLWQVDIPIGTAWWSWYILRCFLCFCKTKGRTQHETSGANAHMWKASISCGDSSDLGSMIKRRSSHFEGDVTIHSESSLGPNMAQQFARFHLGFVLKFFWLLCNLLCIICVLSKRRILGFFWEENAGSLRGTREARM